MSETTSCNDRIQTEAQLYRQLTLTRTRLQISLRQIRLIRGKLDALSSRYAKAKATGNIRHCYSIKLRISVVVGVWEMYREYAKVYAALLTSARQAHNIYTFFANLQERYYGDHIQRAVDTDGYNFTDDEMEEFIVDVTEDALYDDDDDDDEDMGDISVYHSGADESEDDDIEGEVAIYLSAVTMNDDDNDDVIGVS